MVSLTDIDDEWPITNQSSELIIDPPDLADSEIDQKSEVTAPAEDDEADADDDEGAVPTQRAHRRRRHRRKTTVGQFMSAAMVYMSVLNFGCDGADNIVAAATSEGEVSPHADLLDRQAFQRLCDEPQKSCTAPTKSTRAPEMSSIDGS